MVDIRQVLYPKEFLNKRILTHPKQEGELRDILEKSGCEQEFVRLFVVRYKHIGRYWEECINKRDWFEILKSTKGIYSMKFKHRSKNLRTLFKFVCFRGNRTAVLLHSFEEKRSKDYRTAIKVASQRLEELGGLFN